MSAALRAHSQLHLVVLDLPAKLVMPDVSNATPLMDNLAGIAAIEALHVSLLNPDAGSRLQSLFLCSIRGAEGKIGMYEIDVLSELHQHTSFPKSYLLRQGNLCLVRQTSLMTCDPLRLN